MRAVDYNQAPLLVIWEVTRACALACKHCRASAEDVRDSRELSLEQGKALIDEVAAMGTPLMVFTGGDPLQRDDLEDLIAHGKSVGLTVATIPAATDRLTRERILSLKAAGVHQLALSLDGVTAQKHDDFRRVEGTFDKVMEAATWIREAGVPLQINTVFGSWNVHDFDAMAQKVESLGVAFWEIFFLVPTGRGATLQSCTPKEFESLFAQIHQFSKRVRFTVKVTEGQHYRRYFAQHDDIDRMVSHPGRNGPYTVRAMPSRPVNAGNGFAFVDHTGEVFPSGFLPLACGNVKQTSFAEVYRNHPTFTNLRDLKQLKGRCADCEYLAYCSGGSRARAYGVTGDYLASEPFCVFA